MNNIGDDLARAYEEGYNDGYRDGVEKRQEQVDAAPTIDAAPVVRCKNCRHSSRIASDISGRMRHCWSGRGRNNGDGFSRVNGDGYCDEGERMDADAPERDGKGVNVTNKDAPERAGKDGRDDAI